MFLALVQFAIVFIYCMHGFALAFGLIARRDSLIELGLGVHPVSMWLLAFAFYTVLLTIIDFILSQLQVSDLIFFRTLNGILFLFMILLDSWLFKKVRQYDSSFIQWYRYFVPNQFLCFSFCLCKSIFANYT